MCIFPLGSHKQKFWSSSPDPLDEAVVYKLSDMQVLYGPSGFLRIHYFSFFISIDTIKVEVVINWHRQINFLETHCFMSLIIQYYNHFMKGFQKCLIQFTHLTQKFWIVVWSEDLKISFIIVRIGDSVHRGWIKKN